MELVKYRLEFEIALLPLTLNQLMGEHWRTRHKNFEQVHTLVHHACSRSIPKKPIEKARVSLWRHSSGELDRDNLYFTFKPIIDGLVRSGVIMDDGFNQVRELYPHQVKIKRGAPRKVVVLVEEL